MSVFSIHTSKRVQGGGLAHLTLSFLAIVPRANGISAGVTSRDGSDL